MLFFKIEDHVAERYVYVRSLEYGVQYDVPYRVESGVNRYETVICLVVDLIVRLSVPERGMVKRTFMLFVRIESFRFSMMTNPNRINPNGQYIRKKSFVIQFNCGKRK